MRIKIEILVLNSLNANINASLSYKMFEEAELYAFTSYKLIQSKHHIMLDMSRFISPDHQ